MIVNSKLYNKINVCDLKIGKAYKAFLAADQYMHIYSSGFLIKTVIGGSSSFNVHFVLIEKKPFEIDWKVFYKIAIFASCNRYNIILNGYWMPFTSEEIVIE